ncbi:PEP-CTERM sorting domain-containing protein [Nostoc sp.]|uniref:PEP-CTERM sorting domain-containing protein n=1 Tax=Nostoc sp. TaxID=1180 RepID=UPI002FF57C8D
MFSELTIINDSNVTIPDSTTNRNSGQISGGSNNGGSIILMTNNILISRPVPEPSAIAGTIFASSLACLAKRKQAAFRKAKV